MAKKQQKIEYKFQEQGLVELISKIQSVHKELGISDSEMKKLNDQVKHLQEISKKFAGKDAIPVTSARLYKKALDGIVDTFTKFSQKDFIKNFDLSKVLDTDAIKTYEKELKKLQNHIKNFKVPKTITVEEATKQAVSESSNETIREKLKNDNVRVSIKNLASKTNPASAEETATITEANKVLERANQIMEERNKLIEEAKRKHEDELKLLNEKLKVYEQIKTYADPNAQEAKSAIEVGKTQTTLASANLQATIDKSVAQGENTVPNITKPVKEQEGAIAKAGKAVLKYQVVWNVLKKTLRESIRTITELDKAITGMTVVTGMSREEAWKYTDQLIQISKASSTALSDVANLTTEYLRQGRTMRDSLKLAEETANMARIAGINSSEAIQYMTAAINGFNMSANAASHVSDIWANLASKSATNTENLAIALSKVSAQANLAGLSIEYTSALLAKGMETTQEAPESIGTALKTVIARMSELSNYGSTLEDGMNVNKVEGALKVVGIQLRDEVGQFRKLEDVLNELGPKWDTLTRNQQQAIAQAVAGTRQQSRFVAIMQDWGRTQELINESMSSQGAAQAQAYRQSLGLEAAMNRMQTAWQALVKDLVNNKLLIGAVNMITNILNMLEKIPNWIKVSLVAAGGILVLHKLLQDFQMKRQNMILQNLELQEKQKQKEAELGEKSDEEAAKEEKINKILDQQLALRNQLSKNLEDQNNKLNEFTELEKKALELEAQKEQLTASKKATTSEKRKNTREQNKLGKEHDEKVNTISSDSSMSDADKQTAIQQANEEYERRINELKEQRVQLDAQSLELHNQIQANKEAQLALEGEFETKAQEYNTLEEQQLTLEQQIIEAEENLKLAQAENVYHMTATEQALVAQNKERIAALELENKKLQLKKQQLQAEIALAKQQGADTTAQKKQLNNLQNTIAKNQTKINKLNEKNNKITSGSANIYAKMANLVGNKLGVNIKGIGEDLKTAGEFVVTLFKDFAALIGQAVVRKKSEQDITKEKQKQNDEDTKSLASGVANAATNKLEEKTEGDITEEKEQQNKEESKGLAWKIKNFVQSKINQKQEKSETRTKVANAGADAADSAAKIPVVGWVIAGIILAAVGVAAGVAIASAGNSASNKTKKLEKGNADVYENKEKIDNQKKLTDEYKSLSNKAALTKEDRERKKELEKSMQDLDESFKGLTGAALVKAVEENTHKLNVENDKLINKNYALAMSLDDVNSSATALASVQNKLQQSQQRMLDDMGLEGEARDAANDMLNTATSELMNNIPSKKDYIDAEQYQKDIEEVNQRMTSSIANIAKASISAITSEEAKEGVTSTTKQMKAFEEAMAKANSELEEGSQQLKMFSGALENAFDEFALLNQLGITSKTLEDLNKNCAKAADKVSSFAKTVADLEMKNDKKVEAAKIIKDDDFKKSEKKILSRVKKYAHVTEDQWDKMSVNERLETMEKLQKSDGGWKGTADEEMEKQYQYLKALQEMGVTDIHELENVDVSTENKAAQKAKEYLKEMSDTFLNSTIKDSAELNAQTYLRMIDEITSDNDLTPEQQAMLKSNLEENFLKDTKDKTTNLLSQIENSSALIDKAAQGEKFSFEELEKIRENYLSGVTDPKEYEKYYDMISTGGAAAAQAIYDLTKQQYRDSLSEIESYALTAQRQLEDAIAKKDTDAELAARQKLAEYKNQTKAIQEQMKVLDEVNVKELRRQAALSNISKLEKDSLKNAKELIEQYKQLDDADSLQQFMDDNMKTLEASLESLNMLEETLAEGVTYSVQDFIHVTEDGMIELSEKWDQLTDKQKDSINGFKTGAKGFITSYNEKVQAAAEGTEKLKDLYKEIAENTIDFEKDWIETYKSIQEAQKDLLVESLNKRKELYQEYFDWLSDQQSEDDREDNIEKLRSQLAALSTATDAASLQKRKDIEQQLQAAEKEDIQEKQSKLQEQILKSLDDQVEATEKYYDQQLKDNKAILDILYKMGSLEEYLEYIKQTDSYQKATDNERAKLLNDARDNYLRFNNSRDIVDVLEYYNDPENYKPKGYSSGGLVDYTGTAVVHGTPAEPEAFLNAEQTALFASLGNSLMAMRNAQSFYGSILNDIGLPVTNNYITIENFDINIQADMRSDQDIAQTGQSLADIFLDRLQTSGIPVNAKK